VAKLIYSMITSLDGYAEAAEGDLGTGPADDQEVHTFIGDRFRHLGTYLYGRRMYETMVFWETVHNEPDVPPHILQYARDCQAAEKIVYSTTLASVSSTKTRIERSFDPDAVRKLKPRLIATSPSTVRTSRRRRSLPDWWTSTTCSSPPAWSAAGSGSFRTACASISSSSRSVPSTAG
jgi:hypothetical protein